MTTFIVQVLPNISWDILVPKKKNLSLYICNSNLTGHPECMHVAKSGNHTYKFAITISQTLMLNS